MNFTREPIIETIISPKEGCKLLVRRSRGEEMDEEHYVDAIEVVSFGRAFFFRSMERPKAFLVPASDYEVIEVKEPRVALKAASHERHIKIGGGREASLRQSPKEAPSSESDVEPVFVMEESSATAEADSEPVSQSRSDKRRDRRRRRHRRSSEDQEKASGRSSAQEGTETGEEASSASEEEVKVLPPVLPTLLPPPPTLISQTLSRYKGKEFMEEPAAPTQEEKKEAEPPFSPELFKEPQTPKEASPDEDEDVYPF